jgi:hypothetical protein
MTIAFLLGYVCFTPVDVSIIVNRSLKSNPSQLITNLSIFLLPAWFWSSANALALARLCISTDKATHFSTQTLRLHQCLSPRIPSDAHSVLPGILAPRYLSLPSWTTPHAKSPRQVVLTALPVSVILRLTRR